MANKALFQSRKGTQAPRADWVNEAGGLAYRFTAKHALAQYAMTGCMNGTFYADAETQLEDMLAMCAAVEPEFVAKTAVYARKHGHMKDMPALLTAALSVLGPEWLAPTFQRVIDNGKMLRNFVQIMRSGALGRKSLGTMPKRLVQEWLNSASDEKLIDASVGQAPSLADVLKMVHPKPLSPAREALYGYVIGRAHNAELLPQALRDYEAFKAGERGRVAKVPFQLLTALELGWREWTAIARTASWQMTRMNLNTFARHGVFKVPDMPGLIAKRLSNPELVVRAQAMPYQLLAAYASVGPDVPEKVREALQDAMEIALQNVPVLDGKVYVLPDVSGSMASPVTGHRKGATTTVRCVDVAALVAASVMHKSPQAEVLAFDTRVHDARLNRRDSVLTNAQRLARFGGGGTNCSLPLAELNRRKAKGDLVIYVSDNESWVDSSRRGATATMTEWAAFKQRNPQARLVCIDLQPYGHAQAQERSDILNVGGFSDAVFEVVARFARDDLDAGHWIGLIEATEV